jgi:PAP2 superfamily
VTDIAILESSSDTAEVALDDRRIAVGSPSVGGAYVRIRRWLTTRRSWTVEMLAVVTLYVLYEATRGLAAGGAAVAVDHARSVASVERTVGLFVEHDVQQAAHAVPGLIGTLGVLYLTLHLGVTGAYLIWLYRRDPVAFPVVRTTLLIATALSVAIFVLYPTAPPRMAGIGLADTVSGGHVDLNRGLLPAFYNPFAAIPSLHFGYALVVGVSLSRHSRRLAGRVAGALYPAVVVVVIVATGNHFLLDAAAGAVVVVGALAAALALRPTTETTPPAPARAHRPPPTPPQESPQPQQGREPVPLRQSPLHRKSGVDLRGAPLNEFHRRRVRSAHRRLPQGLLSCLEHEITDRSGTDIDTR